MHCLCPLFQEGIPLHQQCLKLAGKQSEDERKHAFCLKTSLGNTITLDVEFLGANDKM